MCMCVYVCMYECMYVYVMCVCMYGQASGIPRHPPPPAPKWYGLLGVRILRKSYASHKPYNVGHVPVLVNLNLNLQ